MDVSKLRREYDQSPLAIDDINDDPLRQFEVWFKQACAAEIPDPNAMVLSTVEKGAPSQRTVLLKYFDHDGFVFFTNYGSRKSRQIGDNAHVALLFPWYALHRQVEINGRAEKISAVQSLKYFASRPRGSQLGAWASPQSTVVRRLGLIESKLEEMKRKFAGGEVPLPSFWGGFRVIPHRFEFWQGRKNRLHDRFQFSQQEAGGWEIERLAP